MLRDLTTTRARLAFAAAGLLVVGGAAGAAGFAALHREPVDWSNVSRSTVARLQDDSIAEISGRVAERFGGRFILADASGRALIDTGPSDTSDVALNENVRVRGRFDDRVVHAGEIIHADGRIDSFGPPRRPPPRDRREACATPEAASPAVAPSNAPPPPAPGG